MHNLRLSLEACALIVETMSAQHHQQTHLLRSLMALGLEAGFVCSHCTRLHVQCIEEKSSQVRLYKDRMTLLHIEHWSAEALCYSTWNYHEGGS